MNQIRPGETSWVWSLEGYGQVEALRLQSKTFGALSTQQVLVEVEAAALNPLDLKLMSGALRDVMPTSFPFVPGGDVCGRVVALGPGVVDYVIGDRVVGLAPNQGAMATHVVLQVGPALCRAPEGLAAADLASLPEAGLTAMSVLRLAGIQTGQVVAIVGATGGIGLTLCQMASLAGAKVVATALPADQALVLRNGAWSTIDYGSGDIAARLLERTPAGFDVVVDLIHQFDALRPLADAVARGGKLISTLMGPDASEFRADMKVEYIRLSPQPGDLQTLVNAVAQGTVKANVSRVFDFEQAPQAYLSLRDMHVVGKVVVRRQEDNGTSR